MAEITEPLTTEDEKIILMESGEEIHVVSTTAITPDPETGIHLEEGKFKKK